MPINAKPSELLGYLRDQKYEGSDNSAAKLLGGFLESYLSGKEVKEERELREAGAQGAGGGMDIGAGTGTGAEISAAGATGGSDMSALAAKFLGNGGAVSGDAVSQAQASPTQRRESKLADFANAFLGNKYRAQETALDYQKAQLESQNLKNQDASTFLQQSPILQQKLLQAQSGMEVDATGLTHPKLLKEFNATVGVIKTSNEMDDMLARIKGEAWQSPDTFQELSRFHAQHPFLNKEQSGALKNTISHVRKNIEVKNTEGVEGLTFMEDPISGERFAVRGKSTLRSGQNPSFGTSKFETAETSSLFRRLEKIESDIRRGKSAAGLRYKPEDLLKLNAEKEQIADQIEKKRPGQKKIEAPEMSVAPTATNPATGEKVQFINGQWQPLE